MTNTVIRSDNLGKLYRLGQATSYRTLRESVSQALSSPFQRFRGAVGGNSARTRQPHSKDLWALKGITFEVGQGEVVGVIGHNGSGKTTLLRILSRITRPTEGWAEISGRVSSLLEVGTGFHPELTGRENIYLNGAVMGMTRNEINRKFNEIVDFSGVSRFIDTPLKRYSTGMQVRLAFSVAAHLEQDILLVDEVLAVGDAQFQEKCLGKMGEVAKSGRTIIFVSHNMPAVSSLCTRTILLDHGNMKAQGPTDEVISHYLSSEGDIRGEIAWVPEDAPGSEVIKLLAVRVRDDQGKVVHDIDIANPVDLEIEFTILRRTTMVTSFHIYNQLGIMLFMVSNMNDKAWSYAYHEPGKYRCSCRIPGNLLNEGAHFVNTYLSHDIRGAPDVCVEPSVTFHAHYFGTSYLGGPWMGLIRPVLQWKGYQLENEKIN